MIGIITHQALKSRQNNCNVYCRWEAVPPSEWPTAPVLRDVIMQDYDFSTVWGDRRQEIVFIGAGEHSMR